MNLDHRFAPLLDVFPGTAEMEMQSALSPQQGSLTHQAVSLDALPIRTASAVKQLCGLFSHICFIEPFRDPGDRPAVPSPYIPFFRIGRNFSHFDPSFAVRVHARCFQHCSPCWLQVEPLFDFFNLNPAADTDVLFQPLVQDPTAMSEKHSQAFAPAGWIRRCFRPARRHASAARLLTCLSFRRRTV